MECQKHKIDFIIYFRVNRKQLNQNNLKYTLNSWSIHHGVIKCFDVHLIIRILLSCYWSFVLRKMILFNTLGKFNRNNFLIQLYNTKMWILQYVTNYFLKHFKTKICEIIHMLFLKDYILFFWTNSTHKFSSINIRNHNKPLQDKRVYHTWR